MSNRQEVKLSSALSIQSRRARPEVNAKAFAHFAAHGDMTCETQVNKLLRRGRAALRNASRLIVDLQGVERADSKLVAAIILLYSQCRRAGVELELHVSLCVQAWLSVYRLDWLSSNSAGQ
jgi:ABC-type transporter Mla MlaB component